MFAKRTRYDTPENLDAYEVKTLQSYPNEQYMGGVPIGTVLPFAGPQAPYGYAWCNGQTLNLADYPELAKSLSDDNSDWGIYKVNGTQFKLPDARGRVPRCYISADDSTVSVGTHVEDAIQNFTGEVGRVSESFYMSGWANGVFKKSGSPGDGYTPDSTDWTPTGAFNINAARSVRTADETRVKSFAVMFIIRLF